MVSSTARRLGRNWSLPNILTYARVAAVPLVAGFLFWPQVPWARWTALAIFIAAGISDFFDGYLARAWSQQSSLGRMLDPIADKLLVAAVILVLAANQTISGLTLLAAIVILCREILVSGLREHLAELRVPLPVTALAKWKTMVQFIALGMPHNVASVTRAVAPQAADCHPVPFELCDESSPEKARCAGDHYLAYGRLGRLARRIAHAGKLIPPGRRSGQPSSSAPRSMSRRASSVTTVGDE